MFNKKKEEEQQIYSLKLSTKEDVKINKGSILEITNRYYDDLNDQYVYSLEVIGNPIKEQDTCTFYYPSVDFDCKTKFSRFTTPTGTQKKNKKK